ncbi:MAG: TonB-dependent receptor [Bacteroidia bacterium]|nr:TonB-dependent receptor [Bacteroidia bacterium]
MIKRNLIIPVFILFCLLPLTAQVKKQETGLKREVTLYNPYKPSLPEVKKWNFLPDMNDTMKVRPDFRYDIRTKPFLPGYIISPIKAAALLPEPLSKLYKSYINIGLGNYFTPLAEISITNERSKKGTIGFYGRHFSTNGKIELQNGKKVFAGYMDNDASLFGRKFFRKNLFEGSMDFSQKTRYAYGYNPVITDYSPAKKDIRLGYNNIGAKASLSSLTVDSTSFSYDFDIFYNYFYNAKNLFQHGAGITGLMAKSYKGFYLGSGIGYNLYKLSDSLLTNPKYIVSISPFIRKSTEQLSFKLGLQALLDKNMSASAEFHIYPDINFSFNIVPSYVSFFAGLSGKLEKNDPLKIISENSFIISDGSLFSLPNTDYQLIVSGGLKGNTGLGGCYLISASYSLISDMLFYSNIFSSDITFKSGRGNYFAPIADEADLLNVHGEMSGAITDKLSFTGMANLYHYTVTDYAWNKPDWDAKAGLKYNLRDKIIAGMEITTEGKRRLIVNGDNLSTFKVLPVLNPAVLIEVPAHFNLDFSVEYRYSKILSLWAKFNNISDRRYYEWAYYPSHRFLCMLGFTYSL